MKKIAFTLLAVAAFTANASSLGAASSEACGSTAELAVVVADASRNGMPWAKIDATMQKFHRDSGPRAREAAIGIAREAYYSWNSFSDSTVRNLAYTKCMTELPPAVRADIRSQ